jgi:hypothetical protein
MIFYNADIWLVFYFDYRTKVDHFTFVLTDLESKYKYGYCRHAQGVQTCLCIIRYVSCNIAIVYRLMFLGVVIML